VRRPRRVQWIGLAAVASAGLLSGCYYYPYGYSPWGYPPYPYAAGYPYGAAIPLRRYRGRRRNTRNSRHRNIRSNPHRVRRRNTRSSRQRERLSR